MGLYDRDYMNRGDDRGSGYGGMGMLWALIVINAVMFLLAPVRSPLYNELQLYCLKGDPRLTGGYHFHFFQLLTAGFLHYGFMHIFFNMYGLYIFGKLVTPHLGGRRFLTLYLVGLLCGNALFLAVNWNNRIALVGASGAVCAVMMAAAMLEPDQRFMMLFMPFTPIKTSTLIICYTILEVVMTLVSENSSVAHLAHLGGFVGGYLCLKLMRRSDVVWDPLRPKRKTASWQSGPAQNHTFTPKFHFRSSPVSREELDALLDKISRNGINSLSQEELARLKQAREEMRR